MIVRLSVFALALSLAVPALAQRPQPSPPAVTVQTVGLSDITVTYSRPGVKERVIWGELVPYGEVWRAGANDKTTFKFEEAVLIEGKKLEAGTYSFYVIPEEESWTLIFNSDSQGHGTDYNEDMDVLRVNVRPEDAPHEEWLRYGFDNLGPYTATAYLVWEKKRAEFTIEVAEHD